MKILISNSSKLPIYEQIVNSIKEEIINGTLEPNEKLPSIRSLAKELVYEEKLKEIEEKLEDIMQIARAIKLDKKDIYKMIDLLYEGE